MFKSCALLCLFLSSSAQTTSDAYVKITSDQGQLAGAPGIYEFTVEVLSGVTIKTYLPSQLTAQNDGINTCLQRSFNVYTPLTSCSYDAQLNMVSFTIPDSHQTGGWIFYDIGHFVNPQQSMLLTGFLIQIFDQFDNLVSQSDPDALIVQIQPNALTMQSLTVSSVQIAAQSTFHFTFTTTNPVPVQGQIQVTFPQNQIAVPTVAPQTQLSIDNGVTWTSVTTAQLTTTAIIFVIPISISANTQIQLKILQLNNPNTMAVTQSFVLATLTQELILIDQVSSGLTVQCTIPAQLTIIGVTVSSKTVGSTTSATFKLSLPIKYSAGGYIIVTLPSTVSFNSASIQCILLVGFVNDMGYCESINSTELRLFGAINQQQLTFSIASGLVNPQNTQPTGNFLIQAFDPDGNLIANSAATPSFGYTPTPGSFAGVTATRSNFTVGQQTNLTISFKNQNMLQTGSAIQIQIPITQLLSSSESIQCQIKISTDSEFNNVNCQISQTTTNLTLTYVVSCTSFSVGYCSAGTQFSLLIIGLKNLGQISTVSTSHSIQIFSMTSDLQYFIDQRTSGIIATPVLIAGHLTQMSLQKTTGLVNAITNLQIKTTILNPIPVDGQLDLTVQDQSFQVPKNGILQCRSTATNQELVCRYSTYSVSGYIQTITVSQLCGQAASCVTSTQLDIIITALRNPKSTFPIKNTFSLQTMTSLQQLIDQGSFQSATGLEVLPESLSFVNLASPEASQTITTGAKQNYQVQVGLNSGIEPSLGQLVLTLPIEVILLTTQTTCSSVSQSTSQTMSCVINNNKNATVTHQFASTNFEKQTILVTIHNAYNPPSTQPSSFAMANTYLKPSTQDQTLYLVESKFDAFKVTANTPNSIKNANITRDVVLVDSATSLVMCFTTFNPLPAESIVKVVFPEDQVVLGSFVQSNMTLQTVQGQQLSFQLAQSALSNSQICIRITGNVKNSASTKVSTTSVQIQTQTKEGFAIDQIIAGIFISPLLNTGPFQYLAVMSTNSTVGQMTDLVFQIQALATLSQGTIIELVLPFSTFYYTSSINCAISGLSQQCQNIITKNDTFGQYVTTVFTVLSQSFNSGANFTVTVSKLQNKYDTAPLLLSNFNVIAQDSAGNGISSSSILLSLTFAANTAGFLSISRSNLIVLQTTNFQLQIQLQTRLPQNALLQIFISQSLVDSVLNPTVSVDGQQITLFMTNDTSQYVLSLQLPAQSDMKQLQVVIGGFKNRYSTDFTSNQGISVLTSVNGYLVDQLQLQNPTDSLVPTKVNVTEMSLSNPKVGQVTQLILKLNLTGSACKDDIVKLTFQSQLIYLFSQIKIHLLGNELSSSSTKDSSNYLKSASFVLPQTVSGVFSVIIDDLTNIDNVRPLNFELLVEVNSRSGGKVATGINNSTQTDILKPAPLISTSFIRNTSLPLQSCSIQFNLTLPKLFQISPSTIFQILIPMSELQIDDFNQCTLQLTQQCSITQFNSSYYVVSIAGLCSSGCQSSQMLQINLLTGFKNSDSQVQTLLPYQITMLDEQYVVAQLTGGLSLLPALKMDINLGQITLSTSNPTVGLHTDLVMKVVVETAIPRGASLLISLPASVFYISNSISCQIQNITQACQTIQTHYDSYGEYYTSLQMTTVSDISLEQTLSLIVTGIRNKFSSAPLESTAVVSITVQSVFGSAVCQSQQIISMTYLPNLLSTISATRLSKIVQQSTTFVISANLYNRLKTGSTMSVQISNYLIGKLGVISVAVNGSPKVTNTTTSPLGFYTFSFYVPKCDDMTSMSIQISGLTNRYSTDDDLVGGVSFQTSIDGYIIEICPVTKLSDNLIPTTSTVASFIISNLVVGHQTQLTTSLVIEGFATQNDIVQIQSLNQNFYLAQSQYLLFNGAQIQASFNKDSNGYFQRIIFVLPSNITSATLLQIFGLQNNDNTAPIIFQFQVTITTNSGGLIAEGVSDLNTQNILIPTSLAVQSIVRDSSEPNQFCQIVFSFFVPDIKQISNKAKLTVMIPATELLTTGQCKDSFGFQCQIQTNTNYHQLVLLNICQNAGCTAGQIIKIQVQSAFQNPQLAKIPAVPYQVQLHDGRYLVAQVSGGIIMTPSLKTIATMLALNITQSVLVAGSFSSVQFTFKVDSDVSGATNLQVSIPPNTLIKDNQVQQSCSLGSVSFSCSLAEMQDQFGGPVFVTKILLQSIQGRVSPNVSISVSINNLRNSDLPRGRQVDSYFGLALIDRDNFVFADAQFAEKDLGNITVASISNFNVTRNKVQPGLDSVKYTFKFTSLNYIRVNQVILFKIPKEQADLNGGIRCNEQTTGYTIQCKQIDADNESDFQLLQVNQWCSQAIKQSFCPPNTPQQVVIIMSNPSTFSNSLNPILIYQVTSNNLVIASSDQGAMITPALAGIELSNVQLQRQKNVLGTRDNLLINVESIGASLYSETNLFIDLPDGFAYYQSLLTCTLNNQSQVDCSATRFHSSDSIAQILVSKVCTQSKICSFGKGIKVSVGNVKNPSTNNNKSSILPQISLTQGKIQITRANINQTLPRMNPASIYIITQVAASCQTFGTCPITISLLLNNPLQKFDYLTVQSPLSFQSTTCYITSGQSVSCMIDNRQQLRLLASGFVNSTLPLKIEVAAIRMPFSTQSITNFTASTFETVNGLALVKDKSTGGNVTVDASPFKTLKIQRSSSILSAGVNFTISFTAPTSSQLIQTFAMSIPSQQVLLQESTICKSSKGIVILCLIRDQLITIQQINDVCQGLIATGCQIQIFNALNPDAVYTGANPQRVFVQLLTHDKYILIDDQTDITPELVPSTFKITSAVITPNNSTTAAKINLTFTFELDQNQGQFMQMTFGRQSYVPIYSQMMELSVLVNDQPTNIVDLSLKNNGSYWAAIEQITFALPKHKSDKVFTVFITGLQNPNSWQTSFDSADLNLTYLRSSLTTIATANFQFSVQMTPETINPITSYSESPYISTQTYLSLSFGVKQTIANNGFIQISLPKTFKLDKNLNCSDLLTSEKIVCKQFASTNLISIPFNQEQSYTGFSLRIGPITNPVSAQTGMVEITIKDGSNGIHAQGTSKIQADIRGSDCQQGCSSCTVSGECVTCDYALVLSEGKCQSVCDVGKFAIRNNCYECQTDCLACQTLNECSICPPNKVQISGFCLDFCPTGYKILSNFTCFSEQNEAKEDGNDSNRSFSETNPVVDCSSPEWYTYQEIKTKEASTSTSTSEICKPIFPPVQCQIQNCSHCGLISSFCDKCSNYRLNGVCLTSCPVGYFDYQNECFKCSPACKSCSGTANICTSCSGGLFHSEKFGSCTEKCPIGTLSNAENCTSCDSECNSCAQETGICTSCTYDQINWQDLYLSDGKCVSSCPKTESFNLRTHKCIRSSLAMSPLVWTLPLCFLSLVVSFASPGLIKFFKRNKGINQVNASAGFICMFNFVNKLGLLVTLWTSNNMGVFIVTGMTLLAVSILGIYEAHTIDIVQRPPVLKIVSQLIGPHSTRLYLSNFLAFFKQDLPSTLQPQNRSTGQFEMCCLAQSALSLIEILNCIGVVIITNMQSIQFGLALNGVAFSVTGLVLHAVILRNARAAVVIAK